MEMATAVYGAQWGNFVFDCERERKEYRTREGRTLEEATYSFWGYVERNRERFTNPLYKR